MNLLWFIELFILTFILSFITYENYMDRKKITEMKRVYKVIKNINQKYQN